MCTVNDELAMHRNTTEENIKLIKDDLLKYIKIGAITIFALLGGIIITKALGFDLISLINSLGL
jgi:hypothetical protein